jgi:hypothetical protein
VVVDVGGAAVDVGEDGDVFAGAAGGLDVEEVGWDEVKGLSVEFEKGVVVGRAEAVVTEL